MSNEDFNPSGFNFFHPKPRRRESGQNSGPSSLKYARLTLKTAHNRYPAELCVKLCVSKENRLLTSLLDHCPLPQSRDKLDTN